MSPNPGLISSPGSSVDDCEEGRLEPGWEDGLLNWERSPSVPRNSSGPSTLELDNCELVEDVVSGSTFPYSKYIKSPGTKRKKKLNGKPAELRKEVPPIMTHSRYLMYSM